MTVETIQRTSTHFLHRFTLNGSTIGRYTKQFWQRRSRNVDDLRTALTLTRVERQQVVVRRQLRAISMLRHRIPQRRSNRHPPSPASSWLALPYNAMIPRALRCYRRAFLSRRALWIGFSYKHTIHIPGNSTDTSHRLSSHASSLISVRSPTVSSPTAGALSTPAGLGSDVVFVPLTGSLLPFVCCADVSFAVAGTELSLSSFFGSPWLASVGAPPVLGVVSEPPPDPLSKTFHFEIKASARSRK